MPVMPHTYYTAYIMHDQQGVNCRMDKIINSRSVQQWDIHVHRYTLENRGLLWERIITNSYGLDEINESWRDIIIHMDNRTHRQCRIQGQTNRQKHRQRDRQIERQRQTERYRSRHVENPRSTNT